MVTKVEYFSNGCAAQYKNNYNFANLCLHEHDFGLSTECNFFATTHGKSPSDGNGVNVKHVTAVESLKRIKYDQILTPGEMYAFCHAHFAHVSFDDLIKLNFDIKHNVKLTCFIQGRIIHRALEALCPRVTKVLAPTKVGAYES